MQVRPGGLAVAADPADGLAGAYLLALGDADPVGPHVPVDGGDGLPADLVVDHDPLTEATRRAGPHHGARRRRIDRGVGRGTEVLPPVACLLYTSDAADE